ncbi:hypothetical protein [Glycomyces sp. NRRL B-16210]|uniref:hypothetical protein n=1 Tax=Glycomyces sp. NRRL B-16210 TaxID=1463821 RepID=UPI0004C2AC8B|nr:hypothetical protein [Glycomyces sp. NRRL B-16210]
MTDTPNSDGRRDQPVAGQGWDEVVRRVFAAEPAPARRDSYLDPERIVLGRFHLEHRRIEVYQLAGRSATSVRLRRIEPAPAVDLGYINRIGSPFARLHLYRAEWDTPLRRAAKDKATAIWHHAARHEAEVDG